MRSQNTGLMGVDSEGGGSRLRMKHSPTGGPSPVYYPLDENPLW